MVSLQPCVLHENKISFFFAATQDFNDVFYFHPAALSDLFAVRRLWQGVHVHGGFESGTKFRMQGRFLRRCLICVTAASAKSESQRKQVGKQNVNPLFPQGNSTTIGCSSVALPL